MTPEPRSNTHHCVRCSRPVGSAARHATDDGASNRDSVSGSDLPSVAMEPRKNGGHGGVRSADSTAIRERSGVGIGTPFDEFGPMGQSGGVEGKSLIGVPTKDR
ncbi:hypothetical protein BRC97_13165 [Halobacteriales archaeon QS_6_71_20]|nr:MAG: hypothetical protein BRC97_13165 [Halobacteriales archaeon QS_6_71_20]